MTNLFRNLAIFFTFFNFVFSAPFSAKGDVSTCLKIFYIAAYDDDNFECVKEFDFFSNNMTTQKSAFTAGKSCFFQIVKEQCSTPDYTLISSNYDTFVQEFTTPPKDDSNCSDTYYMYNQAKCEAMMSDVAQKTLKISKVDTKINDTRILKLVEQCKNVQTCMNSTCNAPDLDRRMADDMCEAIEMKNSPFMACQFKIHKERPDLSKYTCTDSIGSENENISVQIEAFTTKKDCTKSIMEGICGKSAVENFDQYAQISVKNLNKMASFMMQLRVQ
ncbi:T20D4.11-like domain-containing protein [Caenorhabditis elegans]|uniref:T20D4.11-like domain-containing protein n=1 Tax=Caenorhabditis elegans TaxID=6239 RepID=Q965Z3_CAEEL|nr:DUF19 domain-containing protein [Caenorhabditis elegans]CCD64285.2 DUF19 domain-containing protein [Caenorhabditis elegans]|eukprot:NP_504998.3 Uncharacterized protein CELE_ZK105.6 [Caenorhabditis elegans]